MALKLSLPSEHSTGGDINLAHLELEGLSGVGVGQADIVGDHQVVEVNVVRHGPQLDTDRGNGRHLPGGLVVEVIGVVDLLWLPLALVVGVVDQRGVPFT